MPYPVTMSTGFTYVPLMKDRKTTIFWINAANFGNAPLHLEVGWKLRKRQLCGSDGRYGALHETGA
jgi:hypothetical protein